jgi:serine/threonine protein kinase
MFRSDESLALIDFGLAKRLRLDAEITGTGKIFGTPYYMSPEQGHAADLDVRSDIYGLGVIFYEMLTGKKPYRGSNAMGIIYQHRNAPVPTLPAALRAYQPLIERMMAKRVDDRIGSAAEILEWL